MNITLAEPWSFHSIMQTVDYPAGTHEVSDEIHAAAIEVGVHKEKSHGDGVTANGAARTTRSPQG